jgi:hypothetical protein
LKDHGSVVSCVRSATLESKGYISGFEGFNVIDALANTGYFLRGFHNPTVTFGFIQALQSGNESELVFRFGASNNS